MAKGQRVVKEDDFIVSDSEDIEYETSSGESGSESEKEQSSSLELSQTWVEWSEGMEVDEKLKEVLCDKGKQYPNPMIPPLLRT